MTLDNRQGIVKDNFIQLKNIFLNILPKDKKEGYIFAFFTSFYLSYSLLLVFKSYITDHPGSVADLYFSFDNSIIFNKGYENKVGHPTLSLFTRPFIMLGNLLSDIFGYKSKGVLLISLCSTMISLSIIYIYRYLKEIVVLNQFPLYLITFFYGFFSTNLILCFTTESFTITAFLLSFTLYYYSSCITKNKNITFLSNSFFALLLGGVTITNFAKGIIPMFFVKDRRNMIILKILLVGSIFALVLLAVELKHGVFSEIFVRFNKFSNPSKDAVFSYIFDWFLGAVMLFPEIIWNTSKQDLYNNVTINMIDVNFYQYWWQYLFVVLVFIFVIISIITNYKNRLVQMVTLLLLVDIVLHVVMRFGINEGFLYGAHWIYTIPIFLGWMYKSVEKTRYKKVYVITITCLFCLMFVNNLNQLINFINIALREYPIL